MELKTIGATIAASAALIAMPLAASALSVTCVGTPAASSISWSASAVDGVAPISFLWSNSGTTSTQVINYTPGTYSISVKATDASSTVATSTCSATVAAPATTTPPTGISTQIAALLAQIAALKAQIAALIGSQQGSGTGTSTPPTTPPGLGKVCDRIETNLSRGRHGGDVQRLQMFLAKQGLMSSSTATGTFGPMTEKALKRLQRDNGIGENGLFGTSTQKFFEKHCEDGDDNGSRPPMGMMGSSTRPTINLPGGMGEGDDRGEGHGPRGMMRLNGATSTPWDGEHDGPNRY